MYVDSHYFVMFISSKEKAYILRQNVTLFVVIQECILWSFNILFILRLPFLFGYAPLLIAQVFVMLQHACDCSKKEKRK
jgi:hypothetical protein